MWECGESNALVQCLPQRGVAPVVDMRKKRTPAFFVDPVIDPLRILYIPPVIEIQGSADNVKFRINVYPLLRTILVALDKRLFGTGQCLAEDRLVQAVLSRGEPKVISARVRETTCKAESTYSSSLIIRLRVSYANTEPRECPTTTTPL